ncbi:bifunctional DNA-formamidopyrimidine glycosylase/DNA-(apurinic or apyrimidinic site) lyase [Chelativorans salis]|uniref:Formamidopyrimidine-DNA glycosylase n=1 Tax=Chelativorans salis TaxID=2978478 RepID=A0ABT2LIW9_9HYPH|nr:bifunctional DNA-formamidopyrimidine glycosylase/DNA-(apurinic or apyrimidinic site) lyase [Chelativorans sp. EGI FJ00035]MCT7374527.1 bifunctional DNA-formamidopyrimidine glycosylase/DNA-(apurinic or apyrimidinic site) lyase [Chelativorans sp. EGI FJ00035]
MPELPEVETVRRGLQPAMEGARVLTVEQRRPDLRFPFPAGFAGRLKDRTVTALGRRAKYLLMHLEDDSVLICHLGMSGSFRVEAGEDEALPGAFHHTRSKDGKHDHVIFHLSGETGPPLRVIYNDPRRFGFMLLTKAEDLDAHPLLAGLGVEPTGNALDGRLLARLLAGRRAPLKAALMDQRVVAGLGNIYACEALWRAKLSPRRTAATLAARDGGETARSARLAEAIRTVIADAIAAGGSSLRDYMQTDGTLGYFQHTFSVYDREGVPCRTAGCEGTVQRIVQGGRSTFYCPACQR